MVNTYISMYVCTYKQLKVADRPADSVVVIMYVVPKQVLSLTWLFQGGIFLLIEYETSGPLHSDTPSQRTSASTSNG